FRSSADGRRFDRALRTHGGLAIVLVIVLGVAQRKAGTRRFQLLGGVGHFRCNLRRTFPAPFFGVFVVVLLPLLFTPPLGLPLAPAIEHAALLSQATGDGRGG